MPNEFNKYEKAIIRVVAHRRGKLSVKQIAELAGLSWITTKKYLDKLVKEGVLLEE